MACNGRCLGRKGGDLQSNIATSIHWKACPEVTFVAITFDVLLLLSALLTDLLHACYLIWLVVVFIAALASLTDESAAPGSYADKAVAT